ncbi:MAG: hypothetical protein ACJ798_01165 [Phenylobacterium sp.]
MDDHQTHEQKLAAALRELTDAGDFDDYRDALGHELTHNMAFLRAQAIVEQFDTTHERLCRTLADCDNDVDEAARRLFAEHLAAAHPQTAKPSDKPVDYQTWRTGP